MICVELEQLHQKWTIQIHVCSLQDVLILIFAEENY
jgi:hypothetical protein